MIKTEFIFYLILFIIIIKLNIEYKNKHYDKSILDESKVKKTMHTFSLLDIISRFGEDIFFS